MNLSLISQYRNHLMGVAIIWVLCYHYSGKGESISGWSYPFFAMGHGGVDIFLFLSGLGLYFSYRQVSTAGVNTIGAFYKRRLLRILPAYFIVIIVSGLVFYKPIEQILLELSCIGFFIPGIPFYDWYIPSLLVLYLIFPLYYKFFIKKPISSTLFAIGIGLFLTLCLVVVGKGTQILFFSRIPIFFIGVILGFYIKQGRSLSKANSIIIIAISILFLILEIGLTNTFSGDFMRKTALSHLPFIFIVPGLCLLLSKGFSLLNKHHIGKAVLVVLNFFGMYSLEIYLVHCSLRQLFVWTIPLMIILAVLLKYLTTIKINLHKTNAL